MATDNNKKNVTNQVVNRNETVLGEKITAVIILSK